MATDVQADIDKMDFYTGYPNSFFFPIWNEFARQEDWDGFSCSEIACCVSYKAGNLDKIQVSNYAQGLVALFQQYLSVGTVPRDGAFIWFDYHDGQGISHTGRVMWHDATTVHTFEGNVGGLTVQKNYPINAPEIALYGYPAYTGQEYNTYNVRKESPEGENLPYYTASVNGGYNSCGTGTGAVTGADVLQNCYGYSQGRMMEMYNDIHTDTPITSALNMFTPFNVEYLGITDADYFQSWTVHQGLNPNDGSVTTNNAYVRTSYISCRKGSTINVDDDSVYKFTVCVYTTASTSGFYAGKSALVTGVYTVPIDGYIRIAIARTDNQAQADSSIKSHFVLSIIKYDSWIRIAQDNNMQISSIPATGSVGIWCNGTTCHTANVEYNDNGWYVSESWRDYPTQAGSWDIVQLTNSDYKPPAIADDASWYLMGFIIPFDVDFPPIGAVPPASGKYFRYAPHFRHMRRMRGN